MSFLGYENQWEFLRKEVEERRIANAYLFAGPSELGKKKMALEFVKLINCQASHFEDRPCGHCHLCLATDKMQNPDLYFISPSSEKGAGSSVGKEIDIGQIRGLRSFLKLKPYMARFKSVVIDQAERMNKACQSALLKIIEEPTERTVFILVSSAEDMLLKTIRSRTQVIRFAPLSMRQMEKLLSHRVSSERLHSLLFLSQGRLGRALRLINNERQFNAWLKMVSRLPELKRASYLERFRFVKDFLGETPSLISPYELLDIFSAYFRALLFFKIGLQQEYKLDFLSHQYIQENFRLKQILKILEFVERLRFLLKRSNINLKIAFETLMIYV